MWYHPAGRQRNVEELWLATAERIQRPLLVGWRTICHRSLRWHLGSWGQRNLHVRTDDNNKHNRATLAFRGPVTPAGWSLQNPDNGTTWVTATVTEGVLCASTTAWTINYYSYNAPGQEDRLVTPQIDLSSTTANHLLFDHAYARYSATYFDGLRVEVSADCGSSWVPVFDESGTSLATAADNTGANWEPADCSDWTTNDIDLSAYDGQVFTLRFAGVWYGCGNGLFQSRKWHDV